MRKDLPLINKDKTIGEAMRCIDRYGLGIAFIIDAKKFKGVVSDGDIRRAILKGLNIDDPIEQIINKEAIVVYENWSEKKIDGYFNRKEVMSKFAKESVIKIPVLDNKECVKDVIYVSKKNSSRIELDKTRGKIEDRKATNIHKVLVIGGAGYLGSILVRTLLHKGYKVRVFDNLMYTDRGIKDLFSNKNFEFIKGDIRNVSDIVEAISGVDAVIHLAAIVGDPFCALNPQRTIEIGCLATYNIVEACKFFQVNRFIFSSTCSVYGASINPDIKLTEDSPLRPISLYARSKIHCENKILEAMDNNFSPTIFRMATLYGYSPNMRFDLVVNLLIAKAFLNKKITIFKGNQWRPFIHLKDAAEVYIKCLEAPIEKMRGKVFNLASENFKIIDVGNIIKSVYPEAKLEVSNKMSDKRDYKVSSNRISQAMRYIPSKKIVDGVIEIKKLFENGIIKNYKDPRYRTSLLRV